MAPTKTLPTMQQVLKYWYGNLSAEEVASRLGVSITMLYRLRKRYKLPPRNADRRSKQQREEDPSEEEIARIAQEIKDSWSEHETAKRWCGPKRSAWQPPAYSYDQKNGTFRSDA